jgi:poly-gamma-glutamate capsule biosynthesis protein CapA/YwtB (metallophosphatase superfamily)
MLPIFLRCNQHASDGAQMNSKCKIILSGLILTSVFLYTSCTSRARANEVPTSAQYPTISKGQNLTDSKSEPTKLSSPTLSPTETPTSSPTSLPTTTILFTGIIVPARCVQAGIDERGDPNYIYENVRDIITEADIAVGTLNATISDSTRHEGCVHSWELVGGANNADALRDAGFDVMSMATNHIKDCGFPSCGDRAFLDTLANFERVGILPVGAGLNLEEAMKPVVVEVNGIRFGFISLGEVYVSDRIFAGNGTPGIARLTKKTLKESIDAAKEVADVVIFLPHSGPEDFIDPSLNQLYWAREAVAAGADLVVMNHAHVPQPYQFLDGVMVFYGLGNFVFDQVWARDHQQSLILIVEFQDTQFLSFRFIPTIVDHDGTVHIADADEAEEILDRIEEASQLLK